VWAVNVGGSAEVARELSEGEKWRVAVALVSDARGSVESIEQEETLEALTMGHHATWWPGPQLVLAM
jgi:hypothetical protein